MASLGFTLFNDPKLSSNGKVSCASCHNLATNGAEITLSPPE
ncbi:cytochrome c551 peroxidase [Vibrio ishigakensis]|uniref:Cytochrome c551 peroxidase n=1 Tax=Vibrio ishigakensis TaxID=1481914 RepID=A0A0B8QHZ8_9VIBR|nr:cytochrome c551 peroxidase [Vibrio ishigakensis]